MTPAEIQSLREWLAHWGDGPNHADPTGQSVPIAKVTLHALLDEADRAARLESVARDIRDRLLDNHIGDSRLLSVLTRANLCALIEQALEGHLEGGAKAEGPRTPGAGLADRAGRTPSGTGGETL